MTFEEYQDQMDHFISATNGVKATAESIINEDDSAKAKQGLVEVSKRLAEMTDEVSYLISQFTA